MSSFRCWHLGQTFGITAIIAYLHGFVGSQLWLYYEERLEEGTVDQDVGASIRDGIKIVAKKGLPPLGMWPYDPTKLTESPTDLIDQAAKEHLVTSYHRLDGPDAYRDCLAQGFPFVLGIQIFDNFQSEAVARCGQVPMPQPNENCLGGHCISVFGYTENGDWICRNSWGTAWGQNGYFILPKAYLETPELACDVWMINTSM